MRRVTNPLVAVQHHVDARPAFGAYRLGKVRQIREKRNVASPPAQTEHSPRQKPVVKPLGARYRFR